MDTKDDDRACPACGGAGGGPFGRAGSAWDTEEYVCPRCDGTGIRLEREAPGRPGLARRDLPAVSEEAVEDPAKKKIVSGA